MMIALSLLPRREITPTAFLQIVQVVNLFMDQIELRGNHKIYFLTIALSIYYLTLFFKDLLPREDIYQRNFLIII